MSYPYGFLNAKPEATAPKPQPILQLKVAYVADWHVNDRVALPVPLQKAAPKEPAQQFWGKSTIAETIQGGMPPKAAKTPELTGSEHFF